MWPLFYNIDPKIIDDRYEKIPAPWEEHNITFDLSLTSLKEEDTSEMVFRQEFAQLREKYDAYNEAFTDGSKSEKVEAAFFYPKDPDKPEQTRLNDDSTVFNAEHEGIPGNEKVDELAKLALNQENHDDKQVIWSDLKLKVNTHLEQVWQTDWDTEVDN
ncbi:RNA-directed DNA polymerase from mobile element jockey [Elysia marginata]|uniref:RNA-directed DNA polymerase from mobile element jockey n=1 Tax=Elysia marginata TaxID=1093978 RepID=A0AAV4J074_9GAST|nr:RNA-directed DNA polymerase from mobile element jockey [Elysia marginata]